MKVELVRPQAFLDISIGAKPVGRIVVELYDDVAPLAAQNFLNLCQGYDADGKLLSYKKNQFHRVIKNFMIQAGDVLNCNGNYGEGAGTGNVSTVNEGKLFPLENKDEPLDKPFKLCTANSDPNSNGSQFFISTYTQSHLTGKHTIFGRVLHGKLVVREIERVNTLKENRPVEEEIPIIEDCGVWDDLMPIPIYNACYDQIGGDIYEEYPEDDENIDKESSELVYNASNIIKESGTLLLKQGRKTDALMKYKKCLRYVMEYIPDEEQEPEWYTKYYDLKKKLYLNITLVYLQIKEFDRAIDFATYMLDLDKSTSQEKGKAHYRRGLAYLAKNKTDLAVKDFTKALEYVPNDEAIKSELQKAQASLEKKKANEKAKYAKFFG